MKNKTRVDKYALKQLIKVVNKKQKFIFGIIGIIFIIWGLLLVPINDIYYIVVLLGALFFIFFVFIFEVIVIHQQKNTKVFKAVTYFMFDFDDFNFVVNTICNGELYSYAKHEYLEIHKIIENKNYMFIFISKTDAYILSKHTLKYKEFEAIKNRLRLFVKKYKEIWKKAV